MLQGAVTLLTVFPISTALRMVEKGKGGAPDKELCQGASESVNNASTSAQAIILCVCTRDGDGWVVCDGTQSSIAHSTISFSEPSHRLVQAYL